MRVTIVVAMAENRTIGKDGDLPWRLPADLKHFKAVTMGKPILMGRKTWESIGRPLPGRLNVVITRDADYRADGVTVVHSLEGALEAARESGADEACVVGGAEIYRLALPLADRLELTEVHAAVEGDTAFPAFDPADWSETARARFEAEDGRPAFSFVSLERRSV